MKTVNSKKIKSKKVKKYRFTLPVIERYMPCFVFQMRGVRFAQWCLTCACVGSDDLTTSTTLWSFGYCHTLHAMLSVGRQTVGRKNALPSISSLQPSQMRSAPDFAYLGTYLIKGDEAQASASPKPYT